MNLEDIAQKLGYSDVKHLEENIYNYGEILPEWWAVVKDLVKISTQDLDEIIEYIEECELTIDGEWNGGRSLDEIIASNSMPELYNRLIELRNNNTRKG